MLPSDINFKIQASTLTCTAATIHVSCCSIKHACIIINSFSNRLIPVLHDERGEIAMNNNIGYLRSPGVDGSLLANAMEHIYEVPL